MVTGLLLSTGSLVVGYGGWLLAGEREPSWIGAAILPLGLVALGLGVVGLLVPGFLPSSL